MTNVNAATNPDLDLNLNTFTLSTINGNASHYTTSSGKTSPSLTGFRLMFGHYNPNTSIRLYGAINNFELYNYTNRSDVSSNMGLNLAVGGDYVWQLYKHLHPYLGGHLGASVFHQDHYSDAIALNWGPEIGVMIPIKNNFSIEVGYDMTFINLHSSFHNDASNVKDMSSLQFGGNITF